MSIDAVICPICKEKLSRPAIRRKGLLEKDCEEHLDEHRRCTCKMRMDGKLTVRAKSELIQTSAGTWHEKGCVALEKKPRGNRK